MQLEDQPSETILMKIQSCESNKVKVGITDIDGVIRGKYIHKSKFDSAREGGFGFCNVVFGWDCADVCYDNTKYTGWHSGYPDALAKIDLNTFREIPWDDNTPFFLCDFVDEKGEALDVCPRQTLKRILKKASAMGYQVKAGMEFEWFNFRESPQSLDEKQFRSPEPITPGMFGYSVIRSSLNKGYFSALMDELNRFDVPLEGLHTETGPGVYEAAIMAADGLTAADRATLFKTAVKEIAYRFGILPSFMAKWSESLPGCSGHIHQSLTDQSGQINAFYDENDPHKMSDTFKHYLAGQLHCLKDLLPFFAPTINSYKRLVEGLWAPTKVAWGVDNRTAAFRAIPGSKKSTRLETRVSGSDVNPYLAIAAAVGSGIYGIENKLSLDDAVKGNAYEAEAESLPKDLYRATTRMAKSEVSRSIFGDEFIDHFAASRHWEWRQYQEAVTDWELKRYFEIV